MKKLVLSALIAGICFGIAIPSFSTELEVSHWWTSGGEAKAVKVLADAFKATGNKWKDNAIGGAGDIARPIIVARIVGGDPMDVAQLNHGKEAQELIKAGLMQDLTELAEKEGWRDFFTVPKLLDACTYEGKIYCVPLNIHSLQWAWLNRNVFQENNIKVPTNWSEWKAATPKLKKAGIIPLATGEGWSLPTIFNVILPAIGGPDLYRQINEQKNINAAKSGKMKKIFEEMAFIRDEMIDKNYVGRSWSEATNMVISGRAAGQIMGDWSQGEWSAAGKIEKEDYECLPGLGVNGVLDAGGDSFYFPKSKDPQKTKAQLQLASLMLSKKIQVDFNLAKGSLPIRSDINMSTANGCMQKGLGILKDPKNILEAGRVSWSNDTINQITDLISEFFADPSYSVEKAHARYVRILSEGT